VRYLLAVLAVFAMTVVSFGAEPKPPDPEPKDPVADPGVWKVIRFGPDPTVAAPAGTAAGNAKTMEVFAGASLTRVRAFAIDDILGLKQDGTAERDAEAWFTLKFCGSKLATNHKWEISTTVHGKGTALAGTNVDGHAWGESVQVVEYTGDNTNVLHGQLVVASSGSVGITVGFPAGFGITLEKQTRSQQNDVFDLKKQRSSAGPGKLCRVLVRTYAKAHVSAATLLGAASASLQGYLRGDLTMKGFCSVGEKECEDSFELDDDDTDTTYRLSHVKPPKGGSETETGTPPPTEPSDDERGTPAEPAEEETEPADPPAEEGGTSTPPAEEETETADPPAEGGTSTPPAEEETETADPPAEGGTSTPAGDSGGNPTPDGTPEDDPAGG